MPAFPKPRQGRPPHRIFRGFNDVHFLTACQFARRPHAATCLPGSDSFIASTVAGIVSRSQRPLPGRDLHSLEHFAFARRTWAIYIAASLIVANMLGFLTGEWKIAAQVARRTLFVGLGVLILAMVVLGIGNAMLTR